jgi:hypothetical protein
MTASGSILVPILTLLCPCCWSGELWRRLWRWLRR